MKKRKDMIDYKFKTRSKNNKTKWINIRLIKLNTTLKNDEIKLIKILMEKYRAVRFYFNNNKNYIAIFRGINSTIGLVYEYTEDDLLGELEESMYLEGNDLFVRERVRTKYNKSFKKEYKTIDYPYNLLRTIKDSNFKYRLLKALLEDTIEDGNLVPR